MCLENKKTTNIAPLFSFHFFLLGWGFIFLFSFTWLSWENSRQINENSRCPNSLAINEYGKYLKLLYNDFWGKTIRGTKEFAIETMDDWLADVGKIWGRPTKKLALAHTHTHEFKIFCLHRKYLRISAVAVVAYHCEVKNLSQKKCSSTPLKNAINT